jgi:hypothetical protein
MTRNDKYELLHGWLFWYDADDDVWKAALQEEFADAIEDGVPLNVIAASTLDELFRFVIVDKNYLN